MKIRRKKSVKVIRKFELWDRWAEKGQTDRQTGQERLWPGVGHGKGYARQG